MKEKEGADVLPCKKIQIVNRRKPEHMKNCYILIDGFFVVGCSEKRHHRYQDIVTMVADELKSGDLVDKASAAIRLQSLVDSLE